MSSTNGATNEARTQDSDWLTLDEALDYAGVDACTLARAVADGGLPAVVLDPWTSGGTLLPRRTIDAWWRGLVLTPSCTRRDVGRSPSTGSGPGL